MGLHASITDRSRQGWVRVKKVGTEEGEGTRREPQALWTLGALLPHHRRAPVLSPGTLPSPRLALAVPGLPRVIQAEQLYLQTQEMGVEEGIPALGLDPALLASDPCHAIPRGVSDGTAAGSELGRIFS